jgi:hypothetical protein
MTRDPSLLQSDYRAEGIPQDYVYGGALAGQGEKERDRERELCTGSSNFHDVPCTNVRSALKFMKRCESVLDTEFSPKHVGMAEEIGN